ncbi:hypothetical protein DP113_18125 [Brasilonema octagenarum UFV-E1]|uniref:Uncharacterized protein n=2 Tax=Brasilonema TaxID=383614 RepID=A0A856MKW0_9CYAN|nr:MULTISPECIES: hypothetical protein [Brasilonema]NMF61781.1 hypothetical protein [Brasilonema octagenarum UFV-OR1]QDL09566.1 hypothetical protein DP114_18195 [Brasilonema sennae CENA114]QDL15921.1 hypothetical protein DP113_18125 [Brasilonema octagenarum UFV-E1]
MTLEQAIEFLKFRGFDPKERPIGDDPSVAVYLTHKVIFNLRNHKNKHGVLYGNVFRNGNYQVEWRELDETSLPATLDYCLKLYAPTVIEQVTPPETPIEIEQVTQSNASNISKQKRGIVWLWGGAIAVLFLGVSTFYITAIRPQSSPQQCTTSNIELNR